MLLNIIMLFIGMIFGVLLVCFTFSRVFNKYKKFQPQAYERLNKELDLLNDWVDRV